MLTMARRHALTNEVLSRSPAETHNLGIRLAQELNLPAVLLLRGLLGMGKTTLTRGVAEGLGLADTSLVSSPSFSLINIYQGRCPIYHVDLYRLSGEREIRSIGIEEFLGKDGVTIVEWSERLPYRVDSPVEVEIEDAGGDARRIRIYCPASPGFPRKTRPRRAKSAGSGRHRRHR
jgi:tRNA threonylcarbamoyladenosine biosynthesis protein TsaE